MRYIFSERHKFPNDFLKSTDAVITFIMIEVMAFAKG